MNFKKFFCLNASILSSIPLGRDFIILALVILCLPTNSIELKDIFSLNLYLPSASKNLCLSLSSVFGLTEMKLLSKSP